MDEPKESLTDKAEQSPGGPSAAVDSGELPSFKQLKKTPASNPSEDEHFFAWSVSNRDLSQLEFYARVLEEAADESVPALERLKFLTVFTSNLDEFFMVRVSGL